MLLGIPLLTWNLPWPAAWLLHHEDHRKSVSLQQHASHEFDLNIKSMLDIRTSGQESLPERIQGQKPHYYHLESSVLNYLLTVKEKQLSLKMKTSSNKTIKPWVPEPMLHTIWSYSCKECCTGLHSLEGYVLNSLTLLQCFMSEQELSKLKKDQPINKSN